MVDYIMPSPVTCAVATLVMSAAVVWFIVDSGDRWTILVELLPLDFNHEKKEKEKKNTKQEETNKKQKETKKKT